MNPRFITFIAVLLVFTIFVLQNSETVKVDFLFWQTESSRAVVLLLTFIAGLATGCLATWHYKLKQNKLNLKDPEANDNCH